MKKTEKSTVISDRKQATIFNIGLNSTSKEEVLRFFRYKIAQAGKFFVITVNPEIVSLAEKDKNYAQILNSADLSLPDGVALLAAVKFLKLETPNNEILKFLKPLYFWILYFYIYTFDRRKLEEGIKLIKGREMFMDIVKLANKKRWRVFLLGGENNEAKLTADRLGLSYKRIKIKVSSGPKLNLEANSISENERKIEQEAVEKINQFNPQILFVAFGAPKQEKWVYKWLPKLSVGGTMVVGGTFRYISSAAKLPPKWMEENGLEWLWRLLTEPWRFGRIFTAVIVFPLRVISYKLKHIYNT